MINLDPSQWARVKQLILYIAMAIFGIPAVNFVGNGLTDVAHSVSSTVT